MTKVIPVYLDDSLDDDDCGIGHPCHYAEELFGDSTTLCNCSPEETRQCAMDV